MTNRYLTATIFFTIAIFFNTVLVAQQPKRPGTTSAVKATPVIAKTFLAKYTGIKGVCTAEEGKQIITLPLSIMDEKNVPYKISSYQFSYKRRGITEDEEGKISPQTDMVAQRFTETPLPEIWRNNITEQLHTGEELYFFDIIVFDKKGHRFFAPELKITIQ